MNLRKDHYRFCSVWPARPERGSLAKIAASLARRGGLPVHAGLSPEARRSPPGGFRRDTPTTLVWASSPKAGRPLRPTHRLSCRACASRDLLRGPRGPDVGRACLGEEGVGGGSLPYGAHPTGAWPATRTEKRKSSAVAAASPWPPSVRLRVPNSPLSSGVSPRGV